MVEEGFREEVRCEPHTEGGTWQTQRGREEHVDCEVQVHAQCPRNYKRGVVTG